MENKLMITFDSLNAPVDGIVKHYEWLDIYEEVRLLFDTYLGKPTEQMIEYVENNPYLGDIDMKRLILTYNIAWNEYSHVESMIKMLQVLDVDCGFNLYHE